jgi:uroporphyrin-III C-methyltransferase
LRERGTLGHAILVGAGPGDPELFTVRATRALRSADLVLYDALVDRRVLNLAPHAHCFYVGKRAGRPSLSQTTIQGLMIRAARRGRVVVRLKSGDPFVLGRGGEEALACEAAGVPVEIVPGITSAIAGPAAVGIPVTHRGLSPGFLVLSAVPASHYEHILGALPPGSVTVVLLMALGARASITSFLLAAGWPCDLPAAIVVGASTEREWSWRGTLEALGETGIPEDRRDLPGLLVLGAVVSLAEVVTRATKGVAAAPPAYDVDTTEEEAAWLRMQAP